MAVHGLDAAHDKITTCSVQIMRLTPLVKRRPANWPRQRLAKYRAKTTAQNLQLISTLTRQIVPAAPRCLAPRQDCNKARLRVDSLVIVIRYCPAFVLRDDRAIPNQPGERVC